MQWFNDASIPNGNVKKFWVIAVGDKNKPTTSAWSSIELEFEKQGGAVAAPCWSDSTDDITLNTTATTGSVAETYNAASTTSRDFDFSTWFLPTRSECSMEFFVSLDGTTFANDGPHANMTVDATAKKLTVSVNAWYSD